MLAAWLPVLVTLPAHADLYRWIDPDTGSVKLSSSPPADARVTAEVVPYRGPATALPKPAAVAPKTALELEGRWRSLLAQLSGLTTQDLANGGEGLRQRLEAYEAARAELDRQDPAGAARRATESAAVLEGLRQGLAAQFGSGNPPAQ
jgi:hypothetical protein